MILKSIIINGFKSFGKKTIIDISKNVTGIVGPNGSGKSNIVEAIRFVIGEQSMKNMRSKSLSDLIHLGEDKLNRASVSLIIENDVERFAKMSDSISPELINFLKVDEIILTREIFIDGESNYKINNTVVRLKDIQYILSMVGIGASAHTIISQGEADNILSATPRDRKEIISEALGLRVLENRLKESKRKLDKTVLHISEVSISRKEIAPEIKELKLTVDKINNLSNIREKLYEEYINYLVVTNYNINLNQEIINNNAGLYEELKNNNDKLSVLKSEIQILDNSQSFIREEMESGRSSKRDMLIELEKEKSVLIYEKNIIIREMSDILEKIDNNDLDNNIIIDKSLVTEFCFNIKTKLIDISNDIKNKNYINIDNKINECFDLLKKTNKWYSVDNNQDNIPKNNKSSKEDYDNRMNDIDGKLLIINEKINTIKDEILEIEMSMENRFVTLRNMVNEEREKEREINIINNKISHNEQAKSKVIEMEEEFNRYLSEANSIIGQSILSYKEIDAKSIIDNYNIYDNKKNIDKYKWKIEEIGVINIRETMDKYETVMQKDKYLESEINDLDGSRIKLNELINDLENRIEDDFNKGLEKLNFLFNNYFHEIFSGGSAKLNTINIDEDKDGEINMNKKDKIGIDINISIPQKKVKSLYSLSGGEKTLVSISILFALTTITPPPFMVLDETDAALDESNAKKYGKLLNRLAKSSRLLVITHNRETMNKCDILYGVTMGQDSSSRILSIKFE